MAVVHCPVCRKPFDSAGAEAMPFCSRRCREIDLGRWLDEKYGFPHQSDREPVPHDPPPERENGLYGFPAE